MQEHKYYMGFCDYKNFNQFNGKIPDVGPCICLWHTRPMVSPRQMTLFLWYTHTMATTTVIRTADNVCQGHQEQTSNLIDVTAPIVFTIINRWYEE